MDDRVTLETLDPHRIDDLQGYLSTYRTLFSDGQREPESTLIRRHRKGTYRSRLLRRQRDIQGFYTFEPAPSLSYALLLFLGVAKAHQGAGYGRRLLRDALRVFDRCAPDGWLIIEAGSDQTPFYLQHGLRMLDIRYRVPAFNDAQRCVPMNLLVYRDPLPEVMESRVLHRIVFHILTHGYRLPEERVVRINQVSDPGGNRHGGLR